MVTPATETSVGKQTKTCTVCGDTVDEEIPMLDTAITSTPDDSQPEGSDSSDTTVDADKNEKTGKALLKVILPLAALAVIGVCAAFFVIRRKR